MTDLVKLDQLDALTTPSEQKGLVLARMAVHSSPQLQKLFELADSESWDEERLATSLQWNFALVLGLDIAPDVCRYLAEEFAARDKTMTLLVSAETGLAVGQVPEDAIYVPAPVSREGTDQLATPLPRLKPEIEAAIIQHQHTAAAEPLLIAKLQDRTRSSELQRAEGDTRLLVATRSGRRALAARLQAELPELLRDHGGSIGRLFARCRINEPRPDACTRIGLILRGHGAILVADSLAMNYRHDTYRAMREMIRTAWGRSLARTVTDFAHRYNATRAITTGDAPPPGLMIGSPDLAMMARQIDVLPVDGVAATTITEPLYLDIHDDAYTLAFGESAAKWWISATATIYLSVDVNSLQPWAFTDLIESGFVAEVVS